MKSPITQVLFGLVALVSIVRCGAPADRPQADIAGVWTSPCDNNQTAQLTIEKDSYTLERTDYADIECSDKDRSIVSRGKVNVSLVNKQAIDDRILFTSDGKADFAFHSEKMLDGINRKQLDVQTAAADLKKAEKDTPVPDPRSSTKKEDDRRKLQVVDVVSGLKEWKAGESRSLSRAQISALGLETMPLGRQTATYSTFADTLVLVGNLSFTRVPKK